MGKARKKKKRKRTMLSLIREARRLVELENGGKKDFSHVHYSSVKDKFDKSSNNIRHPEDLE